MRLERIGTNFLHAHEANAIVRLGEDPKGRTVDPGPSSVGHANQRRAIPDGETPRALVAGAGLLPLAAATADFAALHESEIGTKLT
jgi:hypothetical protein